jgi:hypothetical protein
LKFWHVSIFAGNQEVVGVKVLCIGCRASGSESLHTFFLYNRYSLGG